MTAIIIELACLIILVIGMISSCVLMHKKLDIIVRLSGADLYTTLKLRGLTTDMATEIVEEELTGDFEGRKTM